MIRMLVIVFAIWLALPATADAHLVTTGLGPFYDGLTHLFISPEDLLPVIAMALFAGIRGPRSGRAVLFVLPAAWLTGSFIGHEFASSAAHQAAWAAITAAATFAIGALVAADLTLPLPITIGIALSLGLLHGGLNGAELAAQKAPGLMPAGTAASLFVVVALLAGQATAMRNTKTRIGLRVAGSWIAAIALLMFGWSLHA